MAKVLPGAPGVAREVGSGALTGGACRFCASARLHSVVDLGRSPLANSYRSQAQLAEAEPFYPLHARVCEACFLVQIEALETPEHIFGDYAYFSSYSESWLAHARAYVEMMTARFGPYAGRQVVEIASNDGYLLQYFVGGDVRVLGIEPAANVAEVARAKGIPTRVAFFGERLARALLDEGVQADLIIGNNVLAHVPDLNDFVRGLGLLLARDGVITLEFPHLLRLMEENQFDTIYHEHFSYFSLLAVRRVFEAHRLVVFDVEELPTHGGSLRLYVGHPHGRGAQPSERVTALASREAAAGYGRLETYSSFGARVAESRRRFVDFMQSVKRAGKAIVGYGAPAKGNTLLNYCGIGPELLSYTVDRSPHKQGLFLPGTHIPIHHPDRIRETKPDYLLILPWNLEQEIRGQMAHVREWGGRFVVPVPEVRVLE